MNTQEKNDHIPVLLEKTVELLSPKTGDSYLDLTAGYGGHAQSILKQTKSADSSVLVDRDSHAIAALESLQTGAKVMQGDFVSVAQQLHKDGRTFNMILLDLGISSPHVDNADRGFSFNKSGPLDMRMDQSQQMSAAELINSSTKSEIVDILRRYGEEPQAQRIAQLMIDSRPFTTTTELAEAISDRIGGAYKRTHPATKTFQALRIAVNDELNQLREVLPIVLELLEPGGRLAVISFHSLEDRIVKKWIKNELEAGYESRVEALTKKPISGKTGDVFNPRARSAMLRGALKK